MKLKQSQRTKTLLEITEMLVDAGEFKLAWRLCSVHMKTEYLRYKKVRHNRKHDALTKESQKVTEDLQVFLFNQAIEDL